MNSHALPTIQSFEKAVTDSDSRSCRKLSFGSARKLCRVSLKNSYRSLIILDVVVSLLGLTPAILAGVVTTS
jgi:hypothetical protein